MARAKTCGAYLGSPGAEAIVGTRQSAALAEVWSTRELAAVPNKKIPTLGILRPKERVLQIPLSMLRKVLQLCS